MKLKLNLVNLYLYEIYRQTRFQYNYLLGSRIEYTEPFKTEVMRQIRNVL